MNRLAFRRATPSLESLEGRLVPAWFLKMDTVPGESSISHQVNGSNIEISSFSLGTGHVELHHEPSAGTPSLQELVLTSVLDSAGPMLLRAFATGQHIPRVTLTAHLSNGAGTEYLKLEMKDVLVSSFSLGGSGEMVPQESVSFVYHQLLGSAEYFAHDPQKHGGDRSHPTLQANQNVALDGFFCGFDPTPGLLLNSNKGPVKKVTHTEKNADGSTTTTVFDGKGNVTHVTHTQKNQDGSTTITESDGQGHVTQVTHVQKNADGSTTTTVTDGKGHVIKVIIERKNADGSTTVSEYDGKGKLVKKTETHKNADGSTTVTETTFTPRGKTVKKTVTSKDQNGATIIKVYVDGKLVSVTKIEKTANGDTVTSVYDGQGHLKKKTVVHKNADGSTTTTEYDDKGNKTKITKVETGEDGTKTTTEADGKGNVTKVTEEKTNADGSKTTTEYEGKGTLK